VWRSFAFIREPVAASMISPSSLDNIVRRFETTSLALKLHGQDEYDDWENWHERVTFRTQLYCAPAQTLVSQTSLSKRLSKWTNLRHLSLRLLVDRYCEYLEQDNPEHTMYSDDPDFPSDMEWWQGRLLRKVARCMSLLAKACPSLEEVDLYPFVKATDTSVWHWSWKISRMPCHKRKGGIRTYIQGDQDWGTDIDESSFEILVGEELETLNL